MKLLGGLFAIAVLCCLTTLAKADDFQMVVVDPNTSFITPITSTTTLDFSFHTCETGEMPSGYTPPFTYVGCFTGQNDSGKTITSLTLEVPHIPGQTAGCAKYDTNASDPFDIFTSISCQDNTDGSYSLFFSGGSIASNPTSCATMRPDNDDNGPDGDHDWDDLCRTGIFTIAEAGVSADGFPAVTGVINPTPEPAPALLLSTGLLMGGLFCGTRRRSLATRRS